MILNIACDDWCNFAYDNMMSLKAIGKECRLLKRNEDPRKYEKQGELAGFDKMRQAIKEADIVQIFFSHVQLTRSLYTSLHGKKVVVYHAGSYYREHTEECNKLFNPIVYKSIIALGEFAGRGAKNEVYIAPSIDTDNIKMHHTFPSKPYVLGHYPSNSVVKGTKEIINMVNELSNHHNFLFLTSNSIEPANKNLERIKLCDIYIELFKPVLNEQKYGSWGLTALEAASMGKIVVTQNLSSEVYNSNYGDCPFILVENEEDFLNKMTALLNKTPLELRELQENTREWVVKNHSYKATGERIWKHIEKD